MLKSKFSSYNDGVLWLCKSVKADTDFSAVTNPTADTDIQKIQKLYYKEMSKRDEDVDFAESKGRKLSIKVKTILRNDADPGLEVVIENTLYSIIKLDKDRNKSEMYLYLEEVRDLESGLNS